MPIHWILGTYGWVQGNIVQKSDRREVKKEDDGKGSGQVQVTYEAHQDFCLMVCESSETRNSTVVGPLMVRVNGKIVYDMRPGANFGAENAKFLEHHTFYVGNEDQVPDPTMEAITGVGNTPSYRGVFTCVCRDINLSQYGDAIPTYEWVMIGEGEEVTTVTEAYEVGVLSRFKNDSDPRVDPPNQYGYKAFWVPPSGAGAGSEEFDSIEECMSWFEDSFGIPAPGFHIGYAAQSDGDVGDYNGSGITFSGSATQDDVTLIRSVVMLYQFVAVGEWTAVSASGACAIVTEGEWIGLQNGSAVTEMTDPSGFLAFANCGGSSAAGYYPLCIQLIRRPLTVGPQPGDPCETGGYALLPDTPGMMIDCDGNVLPAPTYSPAPAGYRVLANPSFETIDGVEYFEWFTVGPAVPPEDPDYDDDAFWVDQYETYGPAAGLPGDWVYGIDYPVAGTDAVLATTTVTTVSTDALSVATAIERICVRGGLAEAQVDTTDVDQTLLGYGIGNTYDGADCIRPLLTAYGLYGADYDGQLHFHKLGEDVDIVIDPGEMIAGETHTDQGEREQAVEYPRVILLNYIDPAQDYSARPQPWRRISPDVRAIGEETVQVPVVMSADDAAQTVDTYGKRVTARAQGTRKFSLPFAGSDEVYLRLHPGKSFGLDSKRWIIDSLSIEDGELAIEATFDRQSAYTSNVTAIPALPPTPPASNIGGVTLFAAMNLPRLRSRDDTPGMYIAVAGLLSSWPGCALQMSIDDGETWTTAFASMYQQSVMGYLTADMDETPGATLSVAVHGGQLNSISDTQFANGGNPSTVLTDAVAEVLQFQDANELDPNEYDLTELGRGRLGTTAATHVQGDRFVQLDNIYFLPIDISLAGRTITFRPVTNGTVPENNASYDVVFLPQFTGPQIVEVYVNESGETYTNESGETYYRVTN